MQSNSITKRYFFKLTTSILLVPLNLLIISIISRSLGPNLFGQYRYLIYFFTLLSSFIGFGGNFLNSELAKNHYDKILISFYQLFMLLLWLVVAIVLILVVWLNGIEYIFPEVKNNLFIWLGFLLAFVTFFSQMYESMTDACGLTKKASLFTFLSKLIGLILLIIFVFFFKLVNLYSILFISIIPILISAFALRRVLISNNINLNDCLITWVVFKHKFKEFFKYSHPLLTVSIVLFSFGFFTRWGLQFFGGSVEQGYFSFSDSFSGFVIIFANSIIPLLQREFSISHNSKDLKKMKFLFENSLLLFIAFASFFSIFLVFNARIFTSIIGGHSFDGSVICTQIMLLYPIPYVGNNILNATCYATNKTKLLRNVQIFIVLLNSIITFLLIAPEKYWGFNLGAIGFAMSLVAVTYLNHIILLVYCSKMFELNWIDLILKYLRIIGAFLIIGLLCFFLDKLLTFNPLYTLILNGLLYFFISVLLLFYLPSLVGFTRLNINEYIEVVKTKWRNISNTN